MISKLLLPAALAAGVFNAVSGELIPFTYDAIPLGSIKPLGWLKDQIQLSADGLGGHEFDFYRYISNSTWIGGEYEYSELKEAAPYWFNYVVPLAWAVDDERLKGQAKYFLDYVLDHQAEDGWLGPETTPQTRGIWARSLFFFGLTQYAEASPEDAPRIVTAMHKYNSLMNSMLKDNFTGLINPPDQVFDIWGFGHPRVHELALSLQWLYDNYPEGNEEILSSSIDLLFQGGNVTNQDWSELWVEGVFPKVGTPYITANGLTHGVNMAEGLKSQAIRYRSNRNESLLQTTRNGVQWTFEYQGALSGTIIADEQIGALSPQRGSELCTAVEVMFSMAYNYRFMGDNSFADITERAAFNALPAAVHPDWWSHQYVTQTNQINAGNYSGYPFWNIRTYGSVFGLEPNYPCCTVNHPQGYPKFLASSFVKKGSNGLAHILLSPSVVKTTLNGGSNAVEVTSDTIYPFGDTLTYSITAQQAFDFYIRIPDWVVLSTSTISVSNRQVSKISPDSSTMLQKVSVSSGNTKIIVVLGSEIRTVQRDYNTVGVYRGALLYALDIPYTIEQHAPISWETLTTLDTSSTDPGHTYDHVLTPTGNWNYAIDPSTLSIKTDSRSNTTLENPIWAPQAPPVSLSAMACLVEWADVEGSADLPPSAPVCIGDKVEVVLWPFGAAKLHIAQFPTVTFT
ncbi:hypothetical protein RUND412_004442 [Rhizina undulata]